MGFTFGMLLHILFEHMSATPAVLADHYVHRDRTLIYKWMNDTAFPSRQLFPHIVRFAVENSSESTRPFIRRSIDQCIASSALAPGQKQELIGEEVFPDHLIHVIHALAIRWKRDKGGIAAEENGSEAAPPSPAAPYAPAAEGADASPAAGMAPAGTGTPPPAWGDPGQTDRIIQISLSRDALSHVALAAAACLAGDGIWAALAWTLRWPNDAWTQGSGLPAFLWGLIFTFPVAALATVSLRGTGPRGIGRGKGLLAAAGSAAAGGAGGLLLAMAGLGRRLDPWIAASAAREILLVFMSALVLTFFPTLVLLALLRFPRVKASAFLLTEFGPALLCVLVALPSILSDVWPGGAFWLGGFLAGAAAKLAMYLSVRQLLGRDPGVTD